MTAEELETRIVTNRERPKLEDAVALAKMLGITEASKLFELLEKLTSRWQIRYQLD